MKKVGKKLISGILISAMVCATFLIHLPSLEVLAAPKMIAHLKSGSGNGNAHFGNGKSEAFVLSDRQDITDDNISYQIKIGSEKNHTRLRLVTKYVNDDQWGYIGWDKQSKWFIEYKNGSSGYPQIQGLPDVDQNDVLNVNMQYKEDGLHVTIENKTAGTKGTALINNEAFVDLKNHAGKIGFGGATYGEEYTDLYFSDVKAGTTVWSDYSNWSLYKEAAGQIFEQAEEKEEQPSIPSTKGRAWIKLTGGKNNGGGHAYGDKNVSAPVTLLDNDKRTGNPGEISLALKPSDNWGVFYTYLDDRNWLYVGYDSSSQWYYQYKIDGKENYPKISGLPSPKAGEEMNMKLSLDRETLSVTVNDITVRVTNQELIKLAEKTNNKGRFGIKTNGQSSISFADFTYNGENCMEDNWVYAAERDGQKMEKTYSKQLPVKGTVTGLDGQGIEKAVVRFGTTSTTTDENGQYEIPALELGSYNMSVSKPGYQAKSAQVKVEDNKENVFDIQLELKQPLDLSQYDSIESDTMKVYIGKEFPLVARYEMKALGEDVFFRGNETDLNKVAINGSAIVPTVKVAETTADSRTYDMHVQKDEQNINLDLSVKVSVEGNNLTWEVIKLEKAENCADIATIDVPGLNLLTIDAVEEGANFAGAKTSTTTTASGDVFLDFEEGFVPSESDGYLYGFLTNEKLSAGLFSNSEIEGDKRVVRNNGADTMSITSAPWYYERGDKKGQARKDLSYPTSDLPCTKVAIAGDINEDHTVDWNDGALAFRNIMNQAYGSEEIKDLVNYRIVMNFASMAPNPYLATADNIKKVYLATDGLPQAVMLKGYGNEGHDSANSEYADIAEREGGVEDFQNLIKIAHDYNTEIGVHINAQEAYPEAASFNEDMLQKPFGNGWGWLDQSHVIDKHWDLATQARYKRLVQFYDRINGTNFYSRKWPEAVEDSKGEITASREEIKADAESREDNMDFIYLDVWYQDAWETRQIAKEINSLGWRFSTEFSAEGEYDSTWQHWSTDAKYGGATAKGYNSDIIRFIRNDQRDSQVLNHPEFGGTADNPLLGGYRLYGFEGWGGDQNFNNYILQTFNQNLPTKFLQHYYVIDWTNYEGEESPVGNHEKEIVLKNDANDKVVVTRNEEQRNDTNIERTITLNGKKVLDDVTYLLPWEDEDGTEKLYHWNLDGGTTTWQLPDEWAGLGNVVMYELSDQGRINEVNVPVSNQSVTLNAKAATAYVLVKGAEIKTLKNDFGEKDYVVDPGFNGYVDGEKLSSDEWSGDIQDNSIVVEKSKTGDQRLAFNSPAKNVAVTTMISGLEKGKDYVAEVNIENNSSAKSFIIVNSGNEEVTNYTEESILGNYVQCDTKHGTKMQRMLVPFTAEGNTAKLTLTREAGEGSTYVDDIRIVEKSLDNFQADGSFKQDFETVVQGLYPFVLSSAQGVTDPVTHLSQLHAPYTQKGWNGRVIDDVIDGEWSLKHHGANTGIIYQTIPQTFRFEPGKVYDVSFEYQSGPDKAYAMIVGNGESFNLPSEENYLSQAHGKEETQKVEMQVVGAGNGQTWIGLYENGSRAGEGKMGEVDFVLDNLTIKENKDASVVEISNKNLYKGETASIYGNKLDEIVWETSNDKVAVVDQKSNKVNALSAGEATLTATFKDGTVFTFDIVVEDSVITEIPREEYPDITSTANTEQASGEPEGSGIASAATDGDSNTYWHSNWAGGVNESNPAILTVDFGKSLEMGGFKFQQRPSTNNGIVYQYRYEVLNEQGETVLSSESIAVPESKRAGKAWIETTFDKPVTGKVLKIYVEEGKGGFAAISEVVPVLVKRVAETAELKDTKINIGEEKQLEVIIPENTMLKGIVWETSDSNIVTVNQNGVIKGVKAGTATISISNAAGLKAECKVTVNKPELDYSELDKAIKNAEAVDLKEYVDGAEKDAFVNALKDAKSVRENAVTQEEVDQAAMILKEAQEALLPVEHTETVDRTKLEEAVKEAEKIDLSKYEDGVEKNAFVHALRDAKEALENASTQSAIDNALEKLLTAQKNLVEMKEDSEAQKVDKSKLEKFYRECVAYYKEDNHSKENWKEYQKVLEMVKEVLNDENATQKDVDHALKELINITEIMNKEIQNPQDAPEAPKTGDLSSTWMWIIFMMAAVVIAEETYRRKRR